MRTPVLPFYDVKSRMKNTCNVKRKGRASPVLGNAQTYKLNYSLRMMATGRYLHKPDRSRLFTEALTTQVKAILADETRLVGTKATIDPRPVSICLDLAKGCKRTIGEIPFQTCGGGKTRLRRESCFVEGYYARIV